jgi:hypothetical protein
VRTRALLLAAGAFTAAGCGHHSGPAAPLRPIVVERPSPGDHVDRTFQVSGTASVFEATVFVQTARNGKMIERKSVTASEGAPGRGTFEATMHASPGHLTVRVFSPSAADGSPQHEVDVAVDVIP